MLNDIFTRTSVVAKLEAGPIGPYITDLVSGLQQQRYASHTIQKYLHAADAFGRWLDTQQIALSEVNEELLAQYVSTLERRRVRSCPRGAPPHEAVGLTHLLSLLREQGVAAPHQPRL